MCVIIPLALVSLLAYALMAALGIGLKVNTLPVVALGAGIGVDYGIYLWSRLRTELAQVVALPAAYLKALRVTGRGVLFTGLTLATGSPPGLSRTLNSRLIWAFCFHRYFRDTTLALEEAIYSMRSPYT